MKDFVVNSNNTIDINLRENTLLEASAGTGKTYSLERVVLNLIKNPSYEISLKDILVVTFTNKATREMKERIRKILKEEGLEDALGEFDEASIYTIHSFCQNALNSFPFESNTLFSQEINKDDELLINSVWDYLRDYESSATDSGLREFYAFRKNKSFTDVVNELVQIYKTDNFKGSCSFLPDKEHTDHIYKLVNEFEAGNCDLKKFLGGFNSITPELMHEASKEMKCGTRITTFEKIKNGLEVFDLNGTFDKFISDFYNDKFCENLYKLTTEFLEKKSRKGMLVSEISGSYRAIIQLADSIFAELDEIIDKDKLTANNYESFLAGEFIKKAVAGIDKIFKKNQESAGVLSFNDLIEILHNRIEDSPQLVDSLRKRYKVALIDEFQDTDKKQWEIFNTIFGQGNEHNFFLIGDPKQSIYGFRSADLEIYYKACREVNSANQYVLGTNYRSETGIVQGANIIFDKVFKVRGLSNTQPVEFSSVKDSGKTPRDIGCAKQNIEFLYWDRDVKDGEILNPRVCARGFFETSVKKIISLLKESSVTPGDIAILVETHKDSVILRDMLQKKGVPVVISKQKNVYKSVEADDILHFLKALNRPGGSGELKTLLLTPLFNYSLAEIHKMEERGELEELSSTLLRWSNMLVHTGIIAVWRELEELTGLQKRVLSYINGERSYTNYKHLIESINSVQRAERLDTYNLYLWLLRTMESAVEDEENSVRLDRDSLAVQIMTIHASKGLEFPVVFFAAAFSSGSFTRDIGIKYAEKGGVWSYDFLKRKKSEIQAISDQWEEKKRLYYVALTRAVSKLYMPLYSNSAPMPLSSLYLSLNWDEHKSFIEAKYEDKLEICQQPVHALLKAANSKTVKEINLALAGQIFSDIEILSNNYSDIFKIDREIYLNESNEVLTSIGGSEELNFASIDSEEFKNRLTWVSSYSALTRDSHGSLSKEDADRADDEDDQEVEYVKSQEINSFNIPGGATFGDLIHEFFEEVDFSLFNMSLEDFLKSEVIEELLNKGARKHFDLEWLSRYKKASKTLIWNTLNSKLDFGGEKIALGEVKAEEKIHEREFYFRVDNFCNIDTHGLSLNFEEGFLKGFIDLIINHNGVLYIADWKTTTIKGEESFTNYATDRVEKSMKEHNYHLQGLIYTVALYLHLKKSKPDFDYNRDIGGYYYFYVRGMSSDGKTGVSFRKPEEREILDFLSQIRGDI